MLRLALFAFALVSMLIRFSRRSPIHGEARPSRSSSHHAEQDPVGGLRSPRKDREGVARSGLGAVRRVTAAGGAPVGAAFGVDFCAPAGGGTRSGGGRPLAAAELRSETDRTPQGDSMWGGAVRGGRAGLRSFAQRPRKRARSVRNATTSPARGARAETRSGYAARAPTTGGAGCERPWRERPCLGSCDLQPREQGHEHRQRHKG